MPPRPQSGNLIQEVVPFFLSAVFFLSGFFTVFAPLPLLFYFLRSNFNRLLLALLVNIVVVWVAGGPLSAGLFSIFVVLLTLSLIYHLILRRRSLERAGTYTLLLMLAAVFTLVTGVSAFHGMSPAAGMSHWVGALVEQMKQLSGGSGADWQIPPEELRHRILVDLPSAVATFSLAMIFLNSTLLLRMNPGGIRDKLGIKLAYFKKWKNPEWLVWPTIAAGAGLVLLEGAAADITLNLFKFLMALYAIQGLSVLSFMLDAWKIRGLWRSLLYILILLFMIPLLLAVGFFDLWFDFRSKLRQS